MRINRAKGKNDRRMWIWFGDNHITLELGRILSWNVGLRLSVRTEDITFGFYLFLFNFYVSFDFKRIRKFLSSHPNYFFKHTGIKGKVREGSYWEERSIDLSLDLRMKSFSGNFWTNMNNHPSSRHFYFFLDNLILGRTKYSKEITKIGKTEIDMPEGRYKATYEYFTSYWKRPRNPFRNKMHRISIEIPVGIPHEGKGTTSYNCGMDATFGVTMLVDEREGIHSVARRFAMSCLKTRQKYGRLSSTDYLKWKKERESVKEVLNE